MPTHTHTSTLPIAPETTSYTLLFGFLAAWFALILSLVLAGAFDHPPGDPPLPTLLAIIIPILGFFGLYAVNGKIRDFVLGLDLKTLSIFHAWRTLGFGFVLLHLQGALPGLFAWPAGLGDMAMGITAPFIVFALLRSGSFATSGRFIWWHVMGLIDFIVAVGTGVISSGAFPALYAASATTAVSPIDVLPMILIPAFIVPLLALTHFAAILKSLHLRRHGPDYDWDGIPRVA